MTLRPRQPAPTCRPTWALAVAALVAILTLLAPPARAQLVGAEPPPEMQDLELRQKPGSQVPPDLTFTTADGATVRIGDYFNRGRPVVLSLLYFRCPMICPLTLSRLMERVNGVSYTLGTDYDVVAVSFDHTERPAAAKQARDGYITTYNQPVTDSVRAGFAFHTSDISNVRMLADAVGFAYRYIPEAGEYSHGSALIILTPDGRVSRYLNGLSGDGSELRLALLEASEGKISRGLADFFLHTCFKWDDKTGAYTLSAFRVMQAGGLLTALGVGTLLVALKAGERARAHRRNPNKHSVPALHAAAGARVAGQTT